jgi:competence ComEA-like helix-hairpin-helix protein
MPLLTPQERNVIIFLLSTALIGSVIGLFRHNWLNNPEILLSHKNLPSHISKIEEEKIISDHNLAIKDQLQKSDIEETNVSGKLNEPDGNISSKSSVELLPSTVVNKTKPAKKKITQNTSELININIASKEDFIKLPYIGEVKAERIIQLRDEMGAFVSIKDLEKVKGIGPKILTKIEPFITIL